MLILALYYEKLIKLQKIILILIINLDKKLMNIKNKLMIDNNNVKI